MAIVNQFPGGGGGIELPADVVPIVFSTPSISGTAGTTNRVGGFIVSKQTSNTGYYDIWSNHLRTGNISYGDIAAGLNGTCFYTLADLKISGTNKILSKNSYYCIYASLGQNSSNQYFYDLYLQPGSSPQYGNKTIHTIFTNKVTSSTPGHQYKLFTLIKQ